MSPVTLRPGQQLCGAHGPLIVIEWVGEGSYARVYRATGHGSGEAAPPLTRVTCVALKLAKTEVAGAADRLRREQEAHACLVHPAIPALVDTGLAQAGAADPVPVPWLARQWVEGESLRRCLERGRGLPLVHAVPLLLRVADAIAALHAAGWSHGDLRTDNILLETGTRQAFLLDLGEALPFGDGGHRPVGVILKAGGGSKGVRRRWRVGAPRPQEPVAAGGNVGQPLSSAPNSRLQDHPSGAVPPVSIERDLRQLGELLAWCLTGVDPAIEPGRLSRAAGYHPAAVQLWHAAREGRLLSAPDFRDQLRQLARQLGITG